VSVLLVSPKGSVGGGTAIHVLAPLRDAQGQRARGGGWTWVSPLEEGACRHTHDAQGKLAACESSVQRKPCLRRMQAVHGATDSASFPETFELLLFALTVLLQH